MRKIILSLGIGLGLGSLLLVGGQAKAAETMPVEVKVLNATATSTESSFLAFPKENQNGATVAVGDIDGDGYGEIVVGAGKGSGPQVRIFSKNGVNEGLDFFAFDKSFRGGVNVATGDVDGDHVEEIVVSQRSAGTARVKVYRANQSHDILADFLAYPESFKGGAGVATGDFDGDGQAEIVTAPGTAGSPLIKFFDGKGTPVGKSFYAFSPTEKGGAHLASLDVDGDRTDELVVGHGPFGDPWVKVYRVDQKSEVVIGAWRALPASFRGGVKVAAADLDEDGKEEVITAAGFGGGPHLMGWTLAGKNYKLSNMAYDKNFTGSVNLSCGDLDRDGHVELVIVPDKKPGAGSLSYFRYIDVSIAEQRLRAYENGELVKTYLVSTGVAKHPTPTGIFSVRSHILSTRMSWVYGPDNPDNYDLPNVPHVLPIYGAITIHGAYWHHNFGHKMSHGCINEPLAEAAWLYAWARNGDVVVVH